MQSPPPLAPRFAVRLCIPLPCFAIQLRTVAYAALLVSQLHGVLPWNLSKQA